jgi:hypothetical protein
MRLRLAHIYLPSWNWDRNIVSSVATMNVLDTVAADLAKSRAGDFLFAHLLMPHYPYVYNADCQARPPSEWRQRRDRDEVDGRGDTNTRETRAIRYALYFQQIRCVDRKIDALIAAIPPSLRHDAIVIIQGDHGSRIGLVEPNDWGESAFTGSDYADFFSTLFAVRSPRIASAYDLRPASITCLLSILVKNDFESMEGLSACSSRNVVFFSDHKPRVLPDLTARHRSR